MKKEVYYQAILELTATKTLTSISVRDIAKHLEISTGSLYYHFKSKEDLLNQMFIYYKTKHADYIASIDSEDIKTLLLKHIEYNNEHKSEFSFVYSTELANILNQESLALSLEAHLSFLDKLGLDYERDSHITTIIFGTIRSYLISPSYMLRCDKEQLVSELTSILNNYKQSLC